MTKTERSQIIKWANTLTNEELEKEYYDAVWDTLGSEAEEMYERGWDMQDILEREKFEKWLGRSQIYLKSCVKNVVLSYGRNGNDSKGT